MNLRDALQVFSAEDSAVDKQDALETQKTTDGNVGSTDTGTQNVVDAVNSVNEVKDVIDGVDTIEQGLGAASEVDAAGDAVLEHADAVKPVLDSGVEPAEVNKAVEHVADIAASIGDTPQHESYRLGLVSVEHSVDGMAYGQLAHEGMLQYGRRLKDTAADAIKAALAATGNLADRFAATKAAKFISPDMDSILDDLAGYKQDVTINPEAVARYISDANANIAIAYHLLYGTGSVIDILKQASKPSDITAVCDSVCKLVDAFIATPKETLGDPSTLEKMHTVVAGLFKSVAVKNDKLQKLVGANAAKHAGDTILLTKITTKGITFATLAPGAANKDTFKSPYMATYKYAFDTSSFKQAVKIMANAKEIAKNATDAKNIQPEMKQYVAAIKTDSVKLSDAVSKLNSFISGLDNNEYTAGRDILQFVRGVIKLAGSSYLSSALQNFTMATSAVTTIFDLHYDAVEMVEGPHK